MAFLILLRSTLIKVIIITVVIIIITRQCLMDDYFGVGESLEEQAFGQGLVARGSQLLVRLVQLRIRLRLKLRLVELRIISWEKTKREIRLNLNMK